MEPLNKKEREKALIDFSLIFALTLIIAVALFVLAFNLPGKINKDTKIKLAKYEQNQKDLDKLVVNVDSLMNMINSLKAGGINQTLTETSIESLLTNLQNKSKDSTNMNFKLYTKFAEITSDLKDQIAKSKSNDNSSSESDCEKNLAIIKQDLKDCKSENLQLQQTNKLLSKD